MGTIPYDEYVRVHLVMTKCTSNIYKYQEALAVAQQDWHRDIRDSSLGLTQEQLYNSLFEIADVWTYT
eukprot:CAMPEP_0175177958 /NCGR_PEP_ID=MMETSP0087-20121206/34676_1 /TAXON_ID=136419 /ORGANISM="Unknown Unknown, Strain D1" /LENGTH=67 /DNA_ID=CAMNT_0016469995 /DNA_START=1 /DNA_END=200 /DNA_ORIENTATION=+